MHEWVITEDAVADYFSSRLGEPVVVDSLKKTFPGMSRETYILRTRIGTEHRGFVLRVDLPAGGMVPFNLEREWEVYRRLWGSPIPVAEPLWFEENIDFAQGRPHMVRDLVDGGTTIAGLTDDSKEGSKLREAVVKDHIEHLAQLHTLDWREYGFDEFLGNPSDPTEALKEEFACWKNIWLEGRTRSFPLMTEALYWLEENIPTDNPIVSLFKGNNGVGEEIYRDNRLVAMSDWELAGLGDGVFDIGFSQGSLALHDFEAAIKYYGQCVGHEVSPQRLAFGIFWIMFKVIVCLDVCGLRKYLNGGDPRVVSAALGIFGTGSTLEVFANSIGKDIVTALHDLSVESESSAYADIGAIE